MANRAIELVGGALRVIPENDSHDMTESADAVELPADYAAFFSAVGTVRLEPFVTRSGVPVALDSVTIIGVRDAPVHLAILQTR